MSDYTHGTLQIRGAVTDEALLEAIAYELDPAETDVTPTEAVFTCDDVNYGLLPDTLVRMLRDRGLSYLWWHGPGDEFSHGVWLYDAETGREAQYQVSGRSLLLSLAEVADSESISKALWWQEWVDHGAAEND